MSKRQEEQEATSGREKVNAMTQRKAIQVLMQSPFYFRMDLAARRLLVKEFCALHDTI